MTPDETRRALEAELEEMAKLSTEAEELLDELAAAFFHAGGEMHELTWPDAAHPHARRELDADVSTEERLRRAEARFRTLVEQIPAVTFMAVLGEGKNEVYVSPHIESMLGYSQEEWLADPTLWYWRLHPDDRALWNEEFSRGCRTGGPFRAECRFLAKDGRVVWVHGEARVAKDERGRPMFLQGVAFDITESKRAQEILLNEAIRGAKIEEELAIARRVQTSLVPSTFDVEGLEIAAAMEPASEVGGDYYDVLPFAGGAWLAIGDVSGHGLNAGLIMMMVQSSVASATHARPTAKPHEILGLVNQVLYDNIRRRLAADDHVTFTLFRYTRDGRFVLAGAHEDVLVFRAASGQCESVRPPGTWLAARRDISRVTVDYELKLERGDVMVLYTDGVTEAMDAKGRQFDLHRLATAVDEVRTASCAAIRDHVVAKVRGWMAQQSDDLSIVVIRYRG